MENNNPHAEKNLSEEQPTIVPQVVAFMGKYLFNSTEQQEEQPKVKKARRSYHEYTFEIGKTKYIVNRRLTINNNFFSFYQSGMKRRVTVNEFYMDKLGQSKPAL